MTEHAALRIHREAQRRAVEAFDGLMGVPAAEHHLTSFRGVVHANRGMRIACGARPHMTLLTLAVITCERCARVLAREPKENP